MTALRRLVVDLNSTAPTMALPAWGAERLRANAPEGWEVVVIQSPTESSGDGTNTVSDETMAAVATAEAYFGYGLPAALVAAAPQLGWAHSASAGVGKSITPALLERGLVFTNSAGVYAEAIADNVLSGVLHFTRGLDHAVRLQHSRVWDKGPFQQTDFPIREVVELTVLVIGAGGIGSAVASRFSALGATCVGVRRRPELGVPAGFARVVGVDAIDTELPTANVVVLAAPLTATSRGVLDARRLALLPHDAMVVNVARGALLDTDALLQAMDNGRIRGAYLDVFTREPLDAESPLWGHPRVLITPHVSGVSPAHHWPRALRLFEENWRRWVAGEGLRNVVDPTQGY